MNSKTKTLLIITIIYMGVIALSYGLFTQIQIESLILKIFMIDVFATVMIWLLSLVLKNASLYDPYWSVIPPLIILLVMIETHNFNLNMVLLLIGISLWAFRLTYNWAKLWTDFSHQDWRYENIKKVAPKIYFLTSLFGIMGFPTLIVFAQHIGIMKLAETNHQASMLSYLGLIVILLATLIQYLSDSQMQRFKKENTDRNKLIDMGLWKYSRHPNYLGEILIWWGVYAFYADAYGFDYFILAPIAMTCMFLFVSIPMLEKKILKTRPHYKKYQEQVSVLIPYKFAKSKKEVKQV